MSGQGNTAPGDLPKTGGYPGLQTLFDMADQFNALDSMVRQIVDGKAFAGLVEVMAVHGGGPSGPPTVDVRPLVNQVNGLSQQTPHGTVHGLPCFRLQAGNAGIIVDPAVGDRGQAVICDRDISTVKATRAQAAPGSSRSNSWSDGCYFGSFLGDAVTQYVQITQSGINIVTTGTVAITSAGLTHNGVNVGATHVHAGVQAGGSNTAVPH